MAHRVFASAELQALTGYSALKQKGRTCSFLQGKDTYPDIRSEGFVKFINSSARRERFFETSGNT